MVRSNVLHLCCIFLSLSSLIPPSQQEEFSCTRDGELRLVGSRKDSEGRVEVCVSGSWGTVCDDDWDNRDAAVVCGALGHNQTNAVASKFGRFGKGNVAQVIVMDEVGCVGVESSLLDCTFSIHDCSHDEDAGVICEEKNRCEEGDVRLVGGSDAKEGRVEVCQHNQWGRVCSEGWDNKDAKVVCNQLQLLTFDSLAMRFGPGESAPFLKTVECSGNEAKITTCSHQLTTQSDQSCYPAGVMCEPPCLIHSIEECSALGVARHFVDREICFCSQDCYDYGYGFCCRDILQLDNCFVTPSECNDNDIRLMNGTETWNGRLEVCLGGHWGAVCQDKFEDRDAAVACRNLGFSSKNAFAVPGGTFGKNDLMWLSGIECQGHESNLTLCQSKSPGFFTTTCKAYDAVGVWCAGEASEAKCSEGSVQLSGGLTNNSGRVEVCIGGVWTSVCSHDWDKHDAQVVCSQLGANKTYSVVSTEFYDPGTGPIVLDELHCTGSESNILKCPRPGSRIRNCDRSEEAGVSCKRDVPQRCDNSSNISSLNNDIINRIGSIEMYTGLPVICNHTFVAYEDYIFIPNSLELLKNGRDLSNLFVDIESHFYESSAECQELFSKYLCNSALFGYSNDTGPTPLCINECTQVQKDCPELWEDYLETKLGEGADCNHTGDRLEPMKYCCTNADIVIIETIEPSTTKIVIVSTNKGTRKSPTESVLAATLTVMILTIVLVVIGSSICVLMYIRRRMKKQRRNNLRVVFSNTTSSRHTVGVSSGNGKTLEGTDAQWEAGSTPDLTRYSNNTGVPITVTLGLQSTVLPTLSPISSRYLRQLTSDMLIPNSQLRLLDAIGTGEFGIVYKAHFLRGLNKANSRNVMPEVVAVKTLKGFFDKDAIHILLEESVKMKHFSHPHVLTLIGVCVDAGPAPYIVMPYMAKGSLQSYLKKERENFLLSENAEEEDIEDVQRKLLDMCNQVAKGMAYLAAKKFVHRDLATRNCMIDGYNRIRVSDFGLSEDMYAKNYFRQDKDACIKLPVKWMAPESLNDGLFTEKSDVWSYGVTCWEIFNAGKTPYPGVNPVSLVRMLEQGERLERPINIACPNFAYDLMLRCWNISENIRPTFVEITVEIEHAMEIAAGYLEMSTIFETVRNKSPFSPDRFNFDSPASASPTELLKGIHTDAGITIQLNKCSDSDSEDTQEETDVQQNPTSFSLEHKLNRHREETSV